MQCGSPAPTLRNDLMLCKGSGTETVQNQIKIIKNSKLWSQSNSGIQEEDVVSFRFPLMNLYIYITSSYLFLFLWRKRAAKAASKRPTKRPAAATVQRVLPWGGAQYVMIYYDL